MDPLNKKERTEAFIKMLLLFLLTVVIVAIPLFYAFQMPGKEQAITEKDVKQMKDQMEGTLKNDKDFLALADSAHSLFELYSKETIEVNRGRISNKFSIVLNKMEEVVRRVEKDTLRKNLYGHIMETYSNLILKNDNINQLKVELKKAAEKAEGGGGGSDSGEKVSPDKQMADRIKAALKKHNGDRKEAAKELDMSERSLKKKMKDLGIQ